MISAIIVNYGTGSLLPRLCARLKDEPLVEQVIVVDNKGDVPDNISGPNITLLRNQTNLGFARAVNDGLKEAKSPWLLVINPDVIPFPGSISTLFNGARQAGAAIAGPRFYWDEEKTFRLPPATGYSLCLKFLQTSGLARTAPWEGEHLAFEWAVRHDRFWSAQAPFWEPFLSGACLLVNRECCPEPLFDERFFLYYEDADLCLSIRTKGLLTMCIPGAEMAHFWSQSPDPGTPKGSLMVESEKRFMEKYYGLQQLPAIFQCRSQARSLQPETIRLNAGSRPPVFQIPVDQAMPLYLEVAVERLFIPFAQAQVTGSSFTFPSKIWNKLPGGTYFTRLRTQAGYPLNVLWEWSKR